MNSRPRVDLKVVLLGHRDVGKTSLVDRYLNDRFNVNQTTTVGAAFGANQVTRGGKSITLGIWDTAGSERYESMTKIYYRSAKGAVVCYDMTNRSSFEKVKFWTTELKANEEGCFIVFAGTKLDLVQEDPSRREVSEEEIESFCKSIPNSTHITTSAKSGHNVKEAFELIADHYMNAPQNDEDANKKYEQFVVTGDKKGNGSKGGCCS